MQHWNIILHQFATLKPMAATGSLESSNKPEPRLCFCKVPNSWTTFVTSLNGSIQYSIHVGNSWWEDQRSPMKCDPCGSSRGTASVSAGQDWYGCQTGLRRCCDHWQSIKSPFFWHLESSSQKMYWSSLLTRRFGWRGMDHSTWMNMPGDFFFPVFHETIYQGAEAMQIILAKSSKPSLHSEDPALKSTGLFWGDRFSSASALSFAIYEWNQVSCWVETLNRK